MSRPVLFGLFALLALAGPASAEPKPASAPPPSARPDQDAGDPAFASNLLKARRANAHRQWKGQPSVWMAASPSRP